MDYSMLGSYVLHCFLEFAEIHVHSVDDAIQPNHPLSPPFPLALTLFQHQGLFQWVCSSHQMGKVLGLQLQHQSFQWISPSNESVLPKVWFPLGFDWFDLLAVQGTLKKLFQHHNLKASILRSSAFYGPALTSVPNSWKNHSFDCMDLWLSGRVVLLPVQEMQETWVRSLGQKDPLEEETQSSILVWRIPWTEKPGGLKSMGSQRVRCNWACTH